jgi:hypothetical protein
MSLASVITFEVETPENWDATIVHIVLCGSAPLRGNSGIPRRGAELAEIYKEMPNVH